MKLMDPHQEIIDNLQYLLRKAIDLEGGFKGLLQRYDTRTKSLKVIAHVGFGGKFLSMFETVKAFDPSACGRALGIGTTVLIKDVNYEKAFAPFIEIVRTEQFVSVKAIPVFSDGKEIIGVLSIHFRTPAHEENSISKMPETHLKKIAGTLQELSKLNYSLNGSSSQY
jgi:hypothetical protein